MQAAAELLLLGKIACPVALTTLLFYSKTIISMLFLGHMEKAELAGGSLALGFANITGFSVMKGLCTGMDPICCQAFGARRWSVLSQTYLKTVVLLLLASIPVAFLWLNVEPVFNRLGQDRIITKIAGGYLIFSLPELFTHANPHTFTDISKDSGTKLPEHNSRHVCVNLAPPYHLHPLFSKVAIKPWNGASFTSLFQGWWPLLSLALPSVCSVCLEWWWYEIIMFLSGLLSNPESCVAAMGILIQTTGTVYVFPFALSLSISQRVGNELGAGEPARAQLAVMIGICVGLAYGISAFGLSIAFKSLWGKLFTNEPQVLALISAALPILGLAEIGNASQTAACGALTGSARPKDSKGLWLGLVASQAACLIMMLYVLAQTDWKHEAKRAEELTLAAGEKDEGVNLVA
ncbi:MATE efflux family protein [Forsythia ovata]|uniref:MATE efflux family protein n=1 Tax=Forsythia ovata TaxID=205694 RepID=A0ABD1X6H5_9LAMI